jgi:ubiquitin-protein ligase
LQGRFQDWPLIRVNSVGGVPTERYQIAYTLNGLYAAPDGLVLERNEHILEINLSLAYPRRAPQCKMLTPIFHPNFDETSVCIGDFWAASEGLDDLVVRIGRMIAFQEYNTKSPLNGIAARWAAEHAHMLPVDSREVSPPLFGGAAEVMESVVVNVPMEARLDVGDLVYLMDGEEVSIGRGVDNGIQIPHHTVSTHHAEIYCERGTYFIRDLNSTNGTFVNEVQVKTGVAAIADNDLIRFGEINCRFLLGAG